MRRSEVVSELERLADEARGCRERLAELSRQAAELRAALPEPLPTPSPPANEGESPPLKLRSL